MAVDTTYLLDAVKRGVTVPSNQVRFTDADILRFGDEETEAVIVPAMTSARLEFFVKYKDMPLVANQAAYKIHYRSIGRTLRFVELRTSTGDLIKDLSYVMPEDVGRITSQAGGDPWAFTVRGDDLILLPTPTTANYVLRQYYELAPAKLIPTSDAGVVQSFSTMTGIVTMSASVTSFATGQSMDLIDYKSGNSNKAEDIISTNVASNLVTFATTDIPSTLTAGDYVCLSNQSPVLQLPNEMHQTLVQSIICRILEALSDFEGLQAAVARRDRILAGALETINPRLASQIPVVINTRGLLRRSNPGNRWRYNL